MAKSLVDESFPVEGEERIRAYERSMEKALSYYSRALEEVKRLDTEGNLADVQAGGSSHGVTEVVYRLHASRLKCLLYAFRCHESCFGAAQIEAVRLTTKYWYGEKPEIPEPLSREITLGLAWDVVADVVSALSQCRLDHQFFHRSVYRYAQALMWAPVFCDPTKGYTEGSIGLIPATKSHKVRGLNNSTPCANSAEVVINTLFEKKRPQLCAVWVTTSNVSPSPLEVLNETTRKYDSLRGKYIQAYVECLKLCNRQSTLDTFLQWVYTCKRDLPSFYQASAKEKGRSPALSHLRDPLMAKPRSYQTFGFLVSVKREVNKAMSHGLLSPKATGDGKRDNNEILKRAYTCFLRLNVSLEELERRKVFKFNRTKLPEVDALMEVFLARKDSKGLTFGAMDWSGGAKKSDVLEAALMKCKALYPALQQALYVKKKSKKSAKTEPGQDEPTNKRAASDGTVQFVVDVPENLKVGEKFETTVRVGDQRKTIRLTVPVGLPSKLKFSLKVPTEESEAKRSRPSADNNQAPS